MTHIIPRVVLKPGTERNGTNGTVVFRRRDEGRTYFCLYVALHRRYRNVHVVPRLVHTVQKVCIAERGYVHESIVRERVYLDHRRTN